MDAEDPNRIVRTITPPGGLDESIWTGVAGDPRPWKEKFYEGARKYYFIIYAHALTSYNLDIRVPTTYIGKYWGIYAGIKKELWTEMEDLSFFNTIEYISFYILVKKVWRIA